MNRITRRYLAPQTIEVLRSAHADFIHAVGNKVPPSVAALYAVPEGASDGAVQWMTSLQGNAVALHDLPSRQVEAFETLLRQKLDAISSLAKALSSEPDRYAKEIALLTQASAAPAADAVYSVNGQPVLLYWGNALPADPKFKVLVPPSFPAVPSTLEEPSIPVVPATPVAPVAPVITAAPPAASSGRRTRWLLALFLLLLIVFLLWWFFCPKAPRQQLTTNVSKPLALSTVESKPVAPVPVVPKPQLVPVKPAPSPPEVVPPKVTVPVKPPLPKTITVDNAKDVCPEDRTAALAPEMIVVFDASNSMRMNISANDAEQKWVFNVLFATPDSAFSNLSSNDVQRLSRIAQLTSRTEADNDWMYKILIAGALNHLGPSDREKLARLLREPTRITTAKQATTSVIQRLPKDVGTGLVVVDRCTNGARNLGRFGPTQRGQILGRLSQLTPHEGTPLADGLLQGGQLADGVTRQSTILLVSDGEESCGGDPCMVARNLKRNKPHLKINVIDIGGTGAANCAAELTGGKVYQASSVNELNAGIERAAQDTLGPAYCQKPN